MEKCKLAGAGGKGRGSFFGLRVSAAQGTELLVCKGAQGNWGAQGTGVWLWAVPGSCRRQSCAKSIAPAGALWMRLWALKEETLSKQ